MVHKQYDWEYGPITAHSPKIVSSNPNPGQKTANRTSNSINSLMDGFC